ncbi:phosphatidylinositol 4,5-bisphosphate 3-kinase catalytic subunit delta isoform-like isoform X2 [Mixophyes fleayi]|uniref:phosphatidylinositol 4,5-bisphosphate 3-kinase catalytic subunit delta isoform-like isoform X2 n=1 Tax=Mixophyes fleayi TaxID=3061075 RepID=UPI003F4D75F8
MAAGGGGRRHGYMNVHSGTNYINVQTAARHGHTKPSYVNVRQLPKAFVDVDFLLPNGIYLNISVPLSATTDNLRKVVWHRAHKQPLFSLLDHPSSYTFSCINTKAQHQILKDDERLWDIDFFLPVLKVVARETNQSQKLIINQMRLLVNRDVHDFENLKDPEVDMSRHRMRQLCEDILIKQKTMTEKEWLISNYPPQLDNFSSPRKSLLVEVNIEGSKNSQALSIDLTKYPNDLITKALKNKAMAPSDLSRERRDMYVLKARGQEDYLHGEHALFQFKYVSECVRRGITPHLTIGTLPSESDGKDNLMVVPSLNPTSVHPNKEVLHWGNLQPNLVSLWDMKMPFQIQIVEGSNVNLNSSMKLMVRAVLFHGNKQLCQAVDTIQLTATPNPTWQQRLEFDISVCDLPRMTCLSLSACSVHNDHRVFSVRKKAYPFAWVNMMVFDYNGKLKSGRHSLSLWPCPDEMKESLNPTGCVGSNPDLINATSLTISFIPASPNPLYYPSIDQIINLGKYEKAPSVTPEEQWQLQEILNQKDQAELHEDEKDLIWKLRQKIQRNHPESICKLLHSTKWNCHEDVAQIIYLLKSWPEISVASALEMLGSSFPDPYVERFAMDCLQRLSNEELSHYILQFVQMLKNKPYLYCELTRFLLERALMNRRIGHYLFWHLRSDMSDPLVALRFSIILEAYCSTNISHNSDLVKQVQALDKMKSLNDFVRSNSLNLGKSEVQEAMRCCLKEETYVHTLSHLYCPLDPSLVLRDLCVERCTFMQSKMKPLLLIYNTDVHGGSEYGVIYKSGDDLRQDMLVLHMIKLMDHLWKEDGLDLRVIPYGCLSTGERTGLIEAVLQSDTIANIHLNSSRRAATAAFNKEAILNWLKSKNSSESLQRAIEEFTLSCAGYCVATYILGIGDRHSDNIMIRETGQLFHIDFGHILGNYKTKFGITRERVPFILTSDFVHVIQGGRSSDPVKFERFRSLCDKAYDVVRQHSVLFLSLFTLMEGAGLPELRSPLDIQYLKGSLAIGLSDEEALKNFRMKFNTALRDSWKTKLNWCAHNLSKDNR